MSVQDRSCMFGVVQCLQMCRIQRPGNEMVAGPSRPKSAVGPFTHRQYRRDRCHRGLGLPFYARVLMLVRATYAIVSLICNASPPFKHTVANPDPMSLNACPHRAHPVHIVTTRPFTPTSHSQQRSHSATYLRFIDPLAQPQPVTPHEILTFLIYLRRSPPITPSSISRAYHFLSEN